EPSRVRVGQRAALTGTGFAVEPGENTVLFDGRPSKVQTASPTRLEVEVPEVVAESGGERRVAVVVRRGDRESTPVEVAVFQGPRLHGISPEAALPGEEVVLAGAGWGPGTTVRFGAAPAQLSEVQSSRIRAVVPEAAGGPGTPAPVVVTVGGVDSNAAPFVVGRLPVVTGAAPAKAAPGDVVEVSGRGFQDDLARNDVRIGGVPALVLESRGDALKVVVPWLPKGEPTRVLEVRVPDSEAVGSATLEVDPPADPVPFRFVAEPFTAVPGRPHAVLSTGLGPAFVVAAASGKTAAARAVEAAGRLNAAGEAIRTTVGLTLEARGYDATPVLALAGRPDALLEVTPEDAAAYGEDWSGLKGRGGAVTPARLARWWEAVGRDIVLLTVRGEKPQNAAALAPEGRVLGQLFDAAQRTGRPGIPRQAVDEAGPPLRAGLRLLALRVPASVTPPAAAAGVAPAAAATPAPARLQLEGTWTGSQVEQGQRQYLTVTFQRGGGSIAYEGGITFTVPLLSLAQPRRDQARFSVQIRGGIRHYVGTWDGETIAGSISTDTAGKNVVATFELRRR
ncbi:MAG TPA: IPT/TIG domain-containing protein, partial [Vicinamibacteria bacterium]